MPRPIERKLNHNRRIQVTSRLQTISQNLMHPKKQLHPRSVLQLWWFLCLVLVRNKNDKGCSCSLDSSIKSKIFHQLLEVSTWKHITSFILCYNWSEMELNKCWLSDKWMNGQWDPFVWLLKQNKNIKIKHDKKCSKADSILNLN